MPDYQKLYTTMFNAATDALDALERLDPAGARSILRDAQQRAEELYLDGEDADGV